MPRFYQSLMLNHLPDSFVLLLCPRSSLASLKRDYPRVPITCLTATATERVVKNVQDILGTRDCVEFRQSFNRPNIVYEVHKKGQIAKSKKDKEGGAGEADSSNNTGVISQMADFVRAHYPGASGIIYCLSKKDCEAVADALRQKGLSVDHYHAGLETAQRKRVQDDWSNDKVSGGSEGRGSNERDEVMKGLEAHALLRYLRVCVCEFRSK
jgi:superfamily II DNA helicase RecQ